MAASPRGEGAGLEGGHASASIQADEAEGQRAQGSERHDGVRKSRQAGHARGDAGEARQPAERVVAEGAHASPVGAEERFGAVAGHVDSGGAVGGAGLAGEAQVEGLEDFGGVDGLNELRVRRLLEDAGPAAGHVFLVARGQVGGTHEGAGHSRAALADTGAAVDGGREVAAVVGEGEAAIRGHGARGDAAQAKVEGVDAGLQLERASSSGEAGIASNARYVRQR